MPKAVVPADQSKIDDVRARFNTCPRFVEMGLQAVLPAGECLVEMEKADGSRLKIAFKGRIDLDLLEVSRLFWAKSR